jgi:hypothetical protein
MTRSVAKASIVRMVAATLHFVNRRADAESVAPGYDHVTPVLLRGFPSALAPAGQTVRLCPDPKRLLLEDASETEEQRHNSPEGECHGDHDEEPHGAIRHRAGSRVQLPEGEEPGHAPVPGVIAVERRPRGNHCPDPVGNHDESPRDEEYALGIHGGERTSVGLFRALHPPRS